MIIIDAHTHLWLRQDTTVDGRRIYPLPNGRAMFMGEERQMLPPFLIDGVNSAEVFLSNMNYAQVSAAVVVQEVIDGNQNDYLQQIERSYPARFFCCGMIDFSQDAADYSSQVLELAARGFKGIAIPAHRLHTPLTKRSMMEMFHTMERLRMVLSICLADDISQTDQMQDVIAECPDLRVAIGHFGMPTGKYWHEQLMLARAPHVYIESGGITWLYNSEFWPFPSAIKAIRKAAETIGVNKLMWGSDYPRTITAITYKMSYDFVLRSDALTDEEKTLFLGENARRFYRFGELTELPYIKNMSED